MTEQHVVERQSVATDPAPADYPGEPIRQSTVVAESVRRSPSGAETARRAIVFLFGLVQALIGVRIVLLLADANQGNAIVRFIYDASAIFVAPFEGVLHTNAVRAGVSVLDIAAVVAIIGWTILEVLIIAGIGVMRREP